MSNETKRDVFEKALRDWDDYVHSWGLQGEEAHGGCEFDPILIKYSKEYDAALPDDLPVIPKVVGGLIKRLKSKPDSTLFDAVDVDHMVYEYDYKWRQAVDNANWIDDHADTFALAWLLGVWRVEETGEIVKLEAEK